MTSRLFDPEHPPYVAGSSTSAAAADRIEPVAGSLRGRVLELIRTAGPITDQQIAERLRMDPSTARPRRVELQRVGLVRQQGTARTRAGREAALWVAV